METFRTRLFAGATLAVLLLQPIAVSALSASTIVDSTQAHVASTTKKALPQAHTESSETSPNAVKAKLTVDGNNASGASLQSPIAPPHLVPLSESTEASAPMARASTLAAAAAGPNLIANPAVESGTTGSPTAWFKGGYGSNTRTFTYPATAPDGTRALKLDVSNYVSGDAKWYFQDVNVTAGATYEYSDDYLSSAPSIVTVRFKKSDGTFTYRDIGTRPAAPSVERFSAQFTVPAGIVSVTIFHLLKSAGSLTTDNFALHEITSEEPPPPPPPTSLVPNGGFETTATNGLPSGWRTNKWGTNAATFPYPVASHDGSKAVRVSMTSRSSGDAKWFFDPLALTPGVYSYSDEFTATVPTTITIQYQNANGTFSYKDLGTVPASGWTGVSADFTVPEGTRNVTVFHVINSVGTLTIDNVQIKQKSGFSGVFATGAVTLRFDDGWLSQLQNAVPKMNAAGMKGSFYIVSQQIAENGFPGFMSKSQIRSLNTGGHEIGAHTRTHRDLTTLSSTQQDAEIRGSREDILSWGGTGEVLSFAYPLGAYNATTVQLVKNAGFTNAGTTIDGFVVPTSDPYQLERRPVNRDTSITQLRSWIDEAAANKRWLILVIHRVESNCGTDNYCTTTATFNSLVDYLSEKGIPVVTTSEGISSLQ